MDANEFVNGLKECGVGLFTGVPDSLLKPFCDALSGSPIHFAAANEGSAVGIAAGYNMSTGKIPCVYMQNSGIGNAVNPITSLTSPDVYGIPTIFVIGWRGEPGVKDEPQHVMQGKVTIEELKVLNVETMVIDGSTEIKDVLGWISSMRVNLSQGNSIALVVRKGALTGSIKEEENDENGIKRESVIECIVKAAGDDVIVTTTGKTSRELFEVREHLKHDHSHDFLTVGSMGHSSMIALGISMSRDVGVWCIDGDGAVFMHMGALATIGANSPKKFIHVVVNNSAHESVGGMPTTNTKFNFSKIAEVCGYKHAFRVSDYTQLKSVLSGVKSKTGPIMIEVIAVTGSRADLGRPTTTTKENKEELMKYLRRFDEL